MIDILIVGSGAAGLTTALKLKELNPDNNIVIVSKTYPTVSQTSQAQGGINAVLDENIDSIDIHIEDTLKSSHGLGNKHTISYMCRNGKDTIKWLDKIGVPFSRTQNGKIAQRKLGGASYPRACYSSDYTGLKILHTLYDNCIKQDIKFLNEHMLLNLIVEENTIKGITTLEIKTSQVIQLLASKVILATGGYAGIYHNHTTNSTSTTSDGIIAAYKAGVKLSNMEFVQFHPTALKNSSILIGESARAEGGYLITKDQKRFVDELLPRDIVSREIYKKVSKGEDVFLDLRHLGKEKILELMPQEYSLVKTYASLELDKDIIPISPAAHYSMGGIDVNIEGKTNIKNLFAIGECADNKVHGANRLGGNSLLEVITFALHTATILSKEKYDNIIQKEYDQFIKDKDDIENIFIEKPTKNFYIYKDNLGDILFNHVGIFRSKDSLQTAQMLLENMVEDSFDMGIDDKSNIYNTQLKEFLEFKNMLYTARIITKEALNRTKSCGAHYRTDEDEI